MSSTNNFVAAGGSPSTLQTQQFVDYQQKLRDQVLGTALFQRLQIREGFDDSKDNVQSTLVTNARKVSTDMKKVLDDSKNAVATYRKTMADSELLLQPADTPNSVATEAVYAAERTKTQNLATTVLNMNSTLYRSLTTEFNTIVGLAASTANEDIPKVADELDKQKFHRQNLSKIAGGMKIETIRTNYTLVMWSAVLIGTVFLGAKILNSK